MYLLPVNVILYTIYYVQVFSDIVVFRILLYAMQVCGYLFTLTTIDRPTECPVVTVVVYVVLMEAIARFYVICDKGDRLYDVVSFVVVII